MARNQLFDSASTHGLVLLGNSAEASKWINYARAQLGGLLARQAGPSSLFLKPSAGVEIKIFTRPNKIIIDAGRIRILFDIDNELTEAKLKTVDGVKTVVFVPTQTAFGRYLSWTDDKGLACSVYYRTSSIVIKGKTVPITFPAIASPTIKSVCLFTATSGAYSVTTDGSTTIPHYIYTFNGTTQQLIYTVTRTRIHNVLISKKSTTDKITLYVLCNNGKLDMVVLNKNPTGTGYTQVTTELFLEDTKTITVDSSPRQISHYTSDRLEDNGVVFNPPYLSEDKNGNVVVSKLKTPFHSFDEWTSTVDAEGNFPYSTTITKTVNNAHQILEVYNASAENTAFLLGIPGDSYENYSAIYNYPSLSEFNGSYTHSFSYMTNRLVFSDGKVLVFTSTRDTGESPTRTRTSYVKVVIAGVTAYEDTYYTIEEPFSGGGAFSPSQAAGGWTLPDFGLSYTTEVQSGTSVPPMGFEYLYNDELYVLRVPGDFTEGHLEKYLFFEMKGGVVQPTVIHTLNKLNNNFYLGLSM